MSLVDTQGRSWAHSSTVKAGDMVRTDAGFTCVGEGVVLRVQADPAHEGLAGMFIECGHGRHYIEGQLGADGELVGLYPVAAPG